MDTSMTKRDLVEHMQANHCEVLAVADPDIAKTMRMFPKDQLVAWHLESHLDRLKRGVPVHDRVRPRPGDHCDDTCTTDCGHCKGAGR